MYEETKFAGEVTVFHALPVQYLIFGCPETDVSTQSDPVDKPVVEGAVSPTVISFTFWAVMMSPDETFELGIF
jgi:hypothetical protein